MDDAATDKLGEDVIYKAVSIFERLVGGAVWVHVEQRPGRKRKNVRGAFQPNLLIGFCAATDICNGHMPVADDESKQVEVWLREPPFIDRMAQRAYELVDLKVLSYRKAAKVFQKEGHDINSGKVWQLRKRYFEMIGQPMPRRPYNNGRPRKRR